ncbi:MAG: DNA gyrase subunit A, partial [Lachnospiraceae bacterium]|nr:DNA gyrase subunit A [Lachnospiraceae bacterium]
MVTKYGMSIRFKETDVRAMGRTAAGVRGIMLQPGDEVVGMQLDSQGPSLLIVSEKGYGKRTKLEEFTLQHRGGKGLKCYKITEKTGDVVGVKAVGDEHELMMITNAGTIIQLRMDDINVYSRITSGVKMINVDEGVTVAKIAKVRADADFEKEKTEGEEG